MGRDAESVAQLLVTFPSPHQALKMERDFKAKNLSVQLMPVPRSISASCGLAIKIEGLNLEGLQSLMAATDICYDEVYLLVAGDKLELVAQNQG